MDPEVLDALRRDSGLTLGGDGVWRFRHDEVAHPRVQKLFHQGLDVRDDGEVVLRVGGLWCYVSCETVGRFIDGVAFDTEAGSFRARMRHGPTISSGIPPVVAIGPDDRLYTWLGDEPVAVFTRPAHHQVVGRLEPASDHSLALVIGAFRWPLSQIPTRPRPDTLKPR